MIVIGTATVRCAACNAPHEVPVSVAPPPGGGDTIRLHVDNADEVCLRLFVQARRGPVVVATR